MCYHPYFFDLDYVLQAWPFDYSDSVNKSMQNGKIKNLSTCLPPSNYHAEQINDDTRTFTFTVIHKIFHEISQKAVVHYKYFSHIPHQIKCCVSYIYYIYKIITIIIYIINIRCITYMK